MNCSNTESQSLAKLRVKLIGETSLELNGDDWLQAVTHALDEGISTSLPFWKASVLVATIHTAADPDLLVTKAASDKERIVGARRGVHAVVPAILTHMTPAPQCVGIRCVDTYIGNIPTAGSDRERLLAYYSLVLKTTHIGSPLDRPPICPAVIERPDVNLYISIERVQHYNDPDIMLAGRLDGSLIGIVSVIDVICVVARSLQEAVTCLGHLEVAMAMIVKASEWAYNPVCHPSLPVCLQVAGDSAWRLFVAGQAAQCSGILIFGDCFNCARLRFPSGLLCPMHTRTVLQVSLLLKRAAFFNIGVASKKVHGMTLKESENV